MGIQVTASQPSEGYERHREEIVIEKAHRTDVIEQLRLIPR